MSFSKYNVNCFTDTIYGGISPNLPKRPRLNSVFVGSPTVAIVNPPRRAKSAIDIQHLLINENKPNLIGFNSMQPIHITKDRRPSITIERPSISGRRRPSVAIERPTISHYYQFKNRRTSCFLERSLVKHKNFMSFEQSPTLAERRKSISFDKPSCSYHTPTISLETSTPSSSVDQPTVIIEQPCHREEDEHAEIHKPKLSKSLDAYQKSNEERPKRRLSFSLDVHKCFDSRLSIPEEDKDGQVVIQLEECQVTEPLLEGLKSSDV